MRNSDGQWEMFDDYVIDFALERMQKDIRVAIVTLVEVEGSSPWWPGAQMAVTETGRWAGYLSGGCVERAVVAEVREAFKEGRSRRVRYGRGSRYMDIQLPCGSAIELVIDIDVTVDDLDRVDSQLRRRNSAVLEIPDPGSPGRLGMATGPFTRLYLPRKRLVVAGIGPVAVQLVRLAEKSGFEVVVASPDEATMRAVDNTGVTTIWIRAVNTGLEVDIDASTGVVLAFHDHEWELKLLPDVLRSNAFYIGAMGSPRTHEARVERLLAAGCDATLIDQIRGPAGVLKGTRGATEIAVSILAEIVQAQTRTLGQQGLLLTSGHTGPRSQDNHAISEPLP